MGKGSSLSKHRASTDRRDTFSLLGYQVPPKSLRKSPFFDSILELQSLQPRSSHGPSLDLCLNTPRAGVNRDRRRVLNLRTEVMGRLSPLNLHLHLRVSGLSDHDQIFDTEYSKPVRKFRIARPFRVCPDFGLRRALSKSLRRQGVDCKQWSATDGSLRQRSLVICEVAPDEGQFISPCPESWMSGLRNPKTGVRNS